MHVFTVRSRASIFKRTIRDNMPLLYSAVGMILVFAGLVTIRPLAELFGFSALGLGHWAVVLGLTVVPTLVAEYQKFWDDYKQKSAERNRVFRHTIVRD